MCENKNTVYRKLVRGRLWFDARSIRHCPNLTHILYLGHKHYLGETGMQCCATFMQGCLKSKVIILN